MPDNELLPIAAENHWVIDQESINIVDCLHKNTGLSKTSLKQIMQKGAVWITHNEQVKRVRRANKILKTGDTLHLYYDESVLNEEPPEPELIDDMVDYSIWNKPYGLRSQGSKWGDHCAINRWVEQHLKPQRPAFIVHRLDRAASGIIIIAHSKKMAAEFSKLFRLRKVKKCYRVWVHGCFMKSSLPVTYDDVLDDKAAVTHVMLLEYDKKSKCSLLDVEIETGRKHQIRRHLSMHGFTVMGDRLYGDESACVDLKLKAFEISFISPVDGSHKHYCLEQTR